MRSNVCNSVSLITCHHAWKLHDISKIYVSNSDWVWYDENQASCKKANLEVKSNLVKHLQLTKITMREDSSFLGSIEADISDSLWILRIKHVRCFLLRVPRFPCVHDELVVENFGWSRQLHESPVEGSIIWEAPIRRVAHLFTWYWRYDL